MAAVLVDEAILDRLEDAPQREQLNIATTIRERLKEGRPAPAIQRRLVALVTNSHNLAKHGYVSMLRALGPGAELDEATIVAVAAGLSGHVMHTGSGADTLSQLLISYNDARRLPDAAMDEIYAALDQTSTSNPVHAIEVLRSVPRADDRSVRSIAAVVAALQRDHPHVRVTASKTLAHYGVEDALPQGAMVALEAIAATDAYMHVRFEAYSALATQASANRQRLAGVLAQELINPTQAVWQASAGYTGYHDLKVRTIELLVAWFDPPYPEYVTDALIAQSQRQYRTTLPYLSQIVRSGGFSDAQRATLDKLAERHNNAQARQALYRLLHDSNSLSVQESLSILEHDPSRAAQTKAAYAIERRFEGQTVPAAVAQIAERVMRGSQYRELRGITARLVARSGEDLATREEKLRSALRTHRNDDEIRKAWFDMYGDEQIETFVATHALDEALPTWTRASMVRELKRVAQPNQRLRDATHASLVEAARRTDSYALNSAILDALQTWDADVPIVVKLKNKHFQVNALVTAFVVLALMFAAASIATLVASLVMPLEDSARAAKRTGLLVLWLLLSVIGLGLFAIAFIGFLGHNSAPNPRHTIMFNLPMYVGMAVFGIYAWFMVRGARARNAEPSALGRP